MCKVYVPAAESGGLAGKRSLKAGENLHFFMLASLG
jgi:hypothetical protein